MYAIVDIAGQQLKVTTGQEVFVHRLSANEGEQITFDKVLAKESEGAVEFGSPLLTNASVKATVKEHLKGDKVLVFKKKRRKGYQKMNGHRQYLTLISIDEII